MIDEERRRLVGGSPEARGAIMRTHISRPLIRTYIFHAVDGVDVQVEEIEGEGGRESGMMFGMHTPSAKKEKKKRVGKKERGSARLSEEQNAAWRATMHGGRGMSHVCARTAARVLYTHARARARIDRRASHTSNTCALLIHARLCCTL